MTETRRSAPLAMPALKPMASATRIALFEREVRERLSSAALDLLFDRAENLSEGQRTVRAGRDAYFGSTMLTIDLPAVASLLRDPCDQATATRLCALLQADGEAQRRIESLARSEAVRLAGATPKEIELHVALRVQGVKVFIDVDVEGTF